MAKSRIGNDHRQNRQLAIVSKVIRNQTIPPAYDQDGNRKSIVPNQGTLQQISDRTAGVVTDIESMRQLLPDIELTTQILISSVLSPKDLSVPRLAFKYSGSKLDEGLATRLLLVIDDYFTNEYKINKNLAHELSEILVNKGAYIRMIVPESTLDDLINGDERLSLTDIQGHFLPRSNFLPNIGFVTREKEDMTMESAFSNDNIGGRSGPVKIIDNLFLSDNPDLVKIPRLYDRINKQRNKDILENKYMTLESVSNKLKKEKAKANNKDRKMPHIGSSDIEIEEKIYSGRHIKTEEVLEIHTKDMSSKSNFGHPLVQLQPIEAVIPAYAPGNPKEHIAYFIIVDQFGNAINTSMAADHYKELQDSFNKNSSDNAVSQVIKELKGTFSGEYTGNNTVENLQQAQQVFGDLLERNLLEKVRLGTSKLTATIARPHALYQTMLARLIAKKQTQVLYVPVELMSYMAFYHTVNGIGRSLLENTRVLGGLRVLMMFTNTMGAIRNSTARTELEIAFDPNDSDPLGTSAMVKSAFMRTRAEGFPLGEGDPVASISYLQNAAVDVVYTGHPDLPEMKITTTDKAPTRTLIDQDLEEKFRERHNMAFGLSPETVDSSKDINFATSIVNSSLLLSKRVLILQEMYEDQQSDFIRKYTLNSEILVSSLLNIVDKAKASEKKKMDDVKIVEHFIRNLEVELPKPDVVTLEAQMEGYEKYKTSLESILDAWFSEDIAFMDGEGDMANYMQDLKASWMAKKLREYAKNNNLFPELEELTAVGIDGKPEVDLGESLAEHMEPLMNGVQSWLQKAKTAAAKRAAKMEKFEEKLGGDDSDSEGDSEGGGDTEGEEQTEDGDAVAEDDAASEDTPEEEPEEDNKEDEEEEPAEDAVDEETTEDTKGNDKTDEVNDDNAE